MTTDPKKRLWIPGGDPTLASWTFEPSPLDPELDLVIVDCFQAETLCVRPETSPDHLISIWDHQTYATEKYAWVCRPCAVVLEYDDVLADKPLHGYVAPVAADVRPVLDLASSLRGRVVVHCAAGISRSSATALVVFAARLGPGREWDAVQAMLEARLRTEERGWRLGGVSPNRTVVALADALLGRKGALVAALEEGLLGVDEWRHR